MNDKLVDDLAKHDDTIQPAGSIQEVKFVQRLPESNRQISLAACKLQNGVPNEFLPTHQQELVESVVMPQV